MGRYKVSSGQNIYDVAIHLYGSIEGIVDLMMNNGDLSLDTVLASGQELVYTDDFVINADVVAYNETHGIVPANGERHATSRHHLPEPGNDQREVPCLGKRHVGDRLG